MRLSPQGRITESHEEKQIMDDVGIEEKIAEIAKTLAADTDMKAEFNLPNDCSIFFRRGTNSGF